MDKKTTERLTAQGATEANLKALENELKKTEKKEQIFVSGTDINKVVDELEKQKNKRKAGPMYAIKSFNAAVNRLNQTKMLTAEQLKQLSDIKQDILQKWMGENLF